MQSILESLFGGPVAGLVGFLLMLVMFMPKVVKWYKARRAQKNEVTEKPKTYGARYIRKEKISVDEKFSDMEFHPDHGEAVDCLEADRKTIVIQLVSWFLPLILVFCLPIDNSSLFGILMIGGVFLACLGLNRIFHLNDRIVFYRTGMVCTLGGVKASVDYNSIFEYHERAALLPGMAPTYILKLSDNRLIVIEGSYFIRGKTRPGELLEALSDRVISSDAEEKLVRG